MRVAGLGFRSSVDVDELHDALRAAGGVVGLTALATVSEKAEAAPFIALAHQLGLPIMAIPADALANITTLTHSDRIDAMFGVGSVAEATALAAAGVGSRLIARRAVSKNGMATAAIAEGSGE